MKFLLLSLVGLSCGATAFGGGYSPARPDGEHVIVDPAIPAFAPAPPLEGTLNIVGGGGTNVPSSMTALIDLWTEIFKHAHPSVVVHRALFSAGSVASTLIEGTAQLGIVNRELLPHENYLYRNYAAKPLGVPVAGGSYRTPGTTPSEVVIVHPQNPLQQLTLAQLDAIYSKTRKRGYPEDITRWGQLGLTGEWADKPIHLYGFQMPDGIPNFFIARVLNGGEFKDGIVDRPLNHSTGGNESILQRVAQDENGIGYINRTAVQPDTHVVKLAETDAGPFSTGTFEETAQRTYPLSRSIFLFLNKEPGKPLDPLAAEFIRVALSQEGQQAVARTYYLPLPASAAKDARALLQ